MSTKSCATCWCGRADCMTEEAAWRMGQNRAVAQQWAEDMRRARQSGLSLRAAREEVRRAKWIDFGGGAADEGGERTEESPAPE